MKKLLESYTLLGTSIDKDDVRVSATRATIRESTFGAQDGSTLVMKPALRQGPKEIHPVGPHNSLDGTAVAVTSAFWQSILATQACVALSYADGEVAIHPPPDSQSTCVSVHLTTHAKDQRDWAQRNRSRKKVAAANTGYDLGRLNRAAIPDADSMF